jgi:hypothetical protein
MEEQLLFEFAKWLQGKDEQLASLSIDQIVSQVAQALQTPEGQKQLAPLFQQFQAESTGMFKKGGKLDYAVRKMKSRGCKSKKTKK